ncbi:MAG: HlyD family efflux transporter periplasmic adaptor subunit [Pseudomonadota bacterium]
MLKSVEKNDALEAEVAATTPPRPKSTSMLLARSALQLALMLAILFGAYTAMQRMIANQPELGGRPAFDRSIPVDTVTIAMGPQRPSLQLFGEVVAGRTLEVRPAAAGEVTSINPSLAVGNLIAAGAALFSIDPFDLEVALAEAEANLAQTVATIVENRARLVAEEAQLGNAQEQLAFAQADYQRALALRDNGTLTAKQVEDRALLVSQRQQSVLQRENNIAIEQARLEQQLAAERRLQLSVERAQRNLSDATVVAPFSGVVRVSNVEVGRQVSANDVAVSMYDGNALEVRFTLTDAQYGRVATDTDPLIGREVDLSWRVGGQQYAYRARISRLGADVASERGGIDVFARIEEPGANEVQLRPGAFVSLRVPDRLYADAARVPEQAVFDGPSVFLVRDGQLTRQAITLFAFDGDEAVIAGVREGDVLLATRLSNAENGLAVRVGDEPPARPRRPEGQNGQGATPERPVAAQGNNARGG